jgi:hypothetical protein
MIPPTREMIRQFAVAIPMEPAQLTKEMLETYLIPLKALQKEVNEHIQRLTKIIEGMK